MPVIRNVNTILGKIEYQLTIKPVKNINLRIRDGVVYVSANSRVKYDAIDNFVKSNSRFIISALHRQAEKKTVHTYQNGDIFYFLGKQLELRLIKDKLPSVKYDDKFIYMSIFAPDNPIEVRKYLTAWFDKQCEYILVQIFNSVKKYFLQFSVPDASLKIAHVKSKWGRCNIRTGEILLNKALIKAPIPSIEYVVVHEFAHFIHPDHSKNFYNFVSRVMPDYSARDAFFKKLSTDYP